MLRRSGSRWYPLRSDSSLHEYSVCSGSPSWMAHIPFFHFTHCWPGRLSLYEERGDLQTRPSIEPYRISICGILEALTVSRRANLFEFFFQDLFQVVRWSERKRFVQPTSSANLEDLSIVICRYVDREA